MFDDAPLDVLLAILVLAVVTPIIIAQSLILYNLGLQAPGSFVDKSMQAVEAPPRNHDGNSRVVTEIDLIMMVVIADSGMQIPRYIYLPQSQYHLDFNTAVNARREIHVTAMVSELNAIKRRQLELLPGNGSLAVFPTWADAEVAGWIMEWRMSKSFSPAHTAGLPNPAQGTWVVEFQTLNRNHATFRSLSWNISVYDLW
jgi:hypothetical protein